MEDGKVMKCEDILQAGMETCETPAYVFDLDTLQRRIASIEEQFGSNEVLCYAMKANPFLVAPLCERVEKFEVCSPGEFRICERAGLDMNKVVLSGVYKSETDVKYVVHTYGAQPTYTVESIEQYKLLKKCAATEKVQIAALIRLSSKNQFGVDKKALEQILREQDAGLHVRIKGLQFYSGTQKRNISQIISEIQALDAYYIELERRFGVHFEELEYGPGIYTSYFNNEDEQDDIILSEVAKAVREINFSGKIILEMGRIMAASCGLYLTSIVDIKETEGIKYCIVDGGIHQVNYYGQTMAMRTPNVEQFPKRAEKADKYNICGSLCTVSDLLIKQFPLSGAKLGDMLVFKKAGAYSVTEGISLFLSRDLPNVYFYSKKEGLKKIRSAQPTDSINSVCLREELLKN